MLECGDEEGKYGERRGAHGVEGARPDADFLRCEVCAAAALNATRAAVGGNTVNYSIRREGEKTGAQSMSRPIIVSIPHSLGKAEALRRLKGGMERVIGH